MIERPGEVAAEKMDRTRSVHNDVVVSQNLHQELEHFLVLGVEPLRPHVEDEVPVAKRASQPSYVVVPLDHRDLIGLL